MKKRNCPISPGFMFFGQERRYLYIGPRTFLKEEWPVISETILTQE